jgi:hypothetical protein
MYYNIFINDQLLINVKFAAFKKYTKMLRRAGTMLFILTKFSLMHFIFTLATHGTYLLKGNLSYCGKFLCEISEI